MGGQRIGDAKTDVFDTPSWADIVRGRPGVSDHGCVGVFVTPPGTVLVVIVAVGRERTLAALRRPVSGGDA